ncbi:MAG: transglycosylase SLT domain-containing protein [Desulfovibrionaceae bacterium]|nr:transglycosylase SLT domain-containing protein [Desulfovibrionaceae bacterium]
MNIRIRRELAALLLLGGAAMAALTAMLPEPPARQNNVLRVLAPRLQAAAASLSPYGPGLEKELVDLFGHGAGLAVRWVDSHRAGDAWQALEEGDADLLLGVGLEAPQTMGGPVAAGPAYAEYKPYLVHSSQRHGLRTPDELCSAPVLVADNPAMERRLAEGAEGLSCVPETEVGRTSALTPVLATLEENRARFALVDGGRFRQLQPFFARVRPAAELGDSVEYRWFWNLDRSRVADALESFWDCPETGERIADLTEKYYGFLPEETDYYELHVLSEALEDDLPDYVPAIAKAARRNRIDPLLLAAVIFQESRFDPDAVSKTNVRGLMQITQDTASVLGVNRLDPVDSIRGGAKYLRQIWGKLEPLQLDAWNRWFFTLAAYNVGIGHVLDAVELARQMGGTGATWRELKKVLPLLAWEKYYSQTKHGYARGLQAVHYVDSIRYYYYVLHGIVTLGRPEAEHLRPLLGIVSARWPLS